MKNILLNNKQFCYILVFFFSIYQSWSQVDEKEYGNNTDPISLLSISTDVNNPLVCKDINIINSGAPNLRQDSNGYTPYSYLQLYIDNNLAPYNWYQLDVVFNVVTLNSNGTDAEIREVPMSVTYNPNTSIGGIGNEFSDLNFLKIENRYGLKVNIKSGSLKAKDLTTNLPIIPSNAFVKLGFKDKRYFTISEQTMVPSHTFVYDGTTQQSATIHWENFPGAIQYELEWTWIDSYSPNTLGDNLLATEINFSERDFELNNTRILTENNNYEIPLIYSKGYLIYRIRPVGLHENNASKKYFGKWSSGTATKLFVSDWNNVIPITEYEKKKNWQFQASYAEDGKKKEVVSYFDGSLRNRQTVTKINSDNNAIVGEVIYDAQGRAAIEILPTPTVGNILKYYKNYNLNTQSVPYNFKNFDLTSSNDTICGIQIEKMINTSGSSKYYSPSNDFKNSRKNHEFIPDAKEFPFSQVEYTPDNTGRISRKGGVGLTHQLGSGHEMQYFYTTPADQKELNRLFGYSVGNVLHYKKNVVVDPNGQVSISYLDPQGRTIATALAGNEPDNLVPLEDTTSTIIHADVSSDILNKLNTTDADTTFDNNFLSTSGNFGVLNDKLSVAKQIIPIKKNTTYNFEYKLNQEQVFTPSVCSQNTYPFVYDLDIKLVDDCNIAEIDHKITLGGVNTSTSGYVKTFSPNLDIKNYSLTKKLQVNENALNQYAEAYYQSLKTEGSSCYISPLLYNPQIAIDVCKFTCEECELEAGLKHDYVLKALISNYNDTTITLVSNDPIVLSAPYNNNAETIPLIERYKREWELLTEECALICEPNEFPFNPCNTNEDSLLADLKPNGQYGFLPEKFRVNSDRTITNFDNEDGIDEDSDYYLTDPKFELSIFNKNSKLFRNNNGTITIINNNFQHPVSPYTDEDGVLSYVDVIETSVGIYEPVIISPLNIITNADGTLKVKPEHLANYRDFYANWDDNWAKSLLPYHPEYYYYLYSKKVCETTYDISTTNTGINSDQYDVYLQNLTFDQAKSSGYISSAGIVTTTNNILINDPYFKDLGADFEIFSNGFSTRYSIMQKALMDSYMNVGSENLNLKQASLYPVKCNNLVPCNYANLSTFNLNELSTEQQKIFWKTYVSNYLSLKNKVRHVYINSYALKNKSYNGCIGTSSSTILGVITDNFAAQKGTINSAISGFVNDFCNSTSASLYSSKQKRFIPIDFGFNSGVDAQSATAELVAQNNYELYVNSGNCPRLLDFELFLNNYFNSNFSLSTSYVGFTGNYLSSELLKDWYGDYSNNPFVPLENGLNYKTLVTGNTIKFLFESPGKTFCNDKNSLTLNFGSSSSVLNWNNYGTTWKIKKFKNLYYDALASNISQKTFAYKAIAVIDFAGVELEILAEGTTCANIGICAVGNTNPDFASDTLDPNASTVEGSAGCSKRYKFQQALLVLINKLKSRTPSNLVNYTASVLVNPISPYLNEFFETSTLSWINTGLNKYEFRDGSTVLYQIELDNTDNINLTSPTQFTGIVYDLANTDLSIHKFNLFININGELKKISIKISSVLDFSCCPIINGCLDDEDCDGSLNNVDNCPNIYNPDQADSNNNNIGDVCEAQNNIACIDSATNEVNFEDKLKQFFNNWLQNTTLTGNYFAVSGNSSLQNFLITTNYANKIIQIRNSNNSTCSAPQLSWYGVVTGSGFIALKLKENNSNFNGDISLDLLEAQTLLQDLETNPNQIASFISINIIPGDNLNNQDCIVQYIKTNGETVVESAKIINSIKILCGPKQDLYYKVPFCEFISNINSNLPTASGRFLSSNSVLEDVTPCKTCIPQTVAPVLADDKFATYVSNLNALNITGLSISITPSSVYEEELKNFRNYHYQYISDSYIQYLTALKSYGLLTSTYDLGYLSISEFGNTYLNYGYAGMSSVVSQYVAYFTNPETLNTPENPKLSWNDWVNIEFRKVNPNICPPKAMEFYSIEVPEDTLNTCETLIKNLHDTYSQEAYNNYLQELKNKFIQEYIAQAMSSVVENFTESHADKEYQYTLYYYDQAGNLTQTVSPEGVDRFEATELTTNNNLINTFRNTYDPLLNTTEDVTLQPEHKLKTQYKYNTLNQLVWQSTPDGGETRFAYDNLGRIIASQNAKQISPRAFGGTVRMSYTKYDELGRITEAGEINGITAGIQGSSTNYFISDEGRLNLVFYPAPNPDPIEVQVSAVARRPALPLITVVNGFTDALNKSEVTRTIYDTNPEVEPSVYATSLFTTNPVGTTDNTLNYNSRNRVTGIFYYDTYNITTPLKYDNAIFYNYDVHGNVKELVTYYTPLRDYNCDTGRNQLNDCQAYLKRVVYNYDLISGNVNTVVFQPKKKDQFIHKYNYDADNRIVDVQTSPDGYVWEKDANYQYYAHGPLSRVEIGNKNVQGVDYAYTLQGWLKSVNGENLKSVNSDMGKDGSTANINKAKDAFGYSLNYFENDYKAIVGDNGSSTFEPLMISRSVTGASTKNLFNGNIKQMTTSIRQQRENIRPIQKNNYEYDQLNRIKAMTSTSFRVSNNGVLQSNTNPNVSASYSYDRNGNILDLKATAPLDNNFDALAVDMDSFAYKYKPGTNQLTKVFDSAADVYNIDGTIAVSPPTPLPNTMVDFKNDIKNNFAELINYDVNDSNTHNYLYDEIGQLIEDKSEGLVIEWRVDGKVKKIIKNRGSREISFIYDGLGNRIAKQDRTIGRNGNDKINSTLYARDAQGNVLGVYDLLTKGQGRSKQVKLSLAENHIYGSSRLGLEEKDLLVYTYEYNCPTCRGGNEEPLNVAPTIATFNQNQIVNGALNINNTNSFAFKGHKVNYSLVFKKPTVNTLNSTKSLIITTLKSTAYNNFKFHTKAKFYTTNTPFEFKEIANLKELRISDVIIRSTIGPRQNSEILDTSVGEYQNKTSVVISTKKNIDGTYTIKTDYYDNRKVVNPATFYVNNNNSINLSTLTNLEKGLKVVTYMSENIPAATMEHIDGINIDIYTTNNSFDLKLNNVLIPITTSAPPVIEEINVPNYPNYQSFVINSNGTTTLNNSFGNSTNSNNVENYQISLCSSSYQFNDAINNTLTGIDDISTSLELTNVVQAKTIRANNLETNVPQQQDLHVNYTTVNIGLNDDAEVAVIGGILYELTPSATATNTLVVGACPLDTDNDGLYDHYEMATLPNGTLVNIDTDGDGKYNFNDNDDDGDGILSQHEYNDPNGNRNSEDARDWDNDGVLDYLDVDDDNDGYATWETLEGGLGAFNNTIVGLPYTLNSDGDGLVNFLDNTNGIYPVNGPIKLINYLSLIGDKRYELANHLGNVLVVINDKKLPEFNITDTPNSSLLNFNADVLSYNDYYPFGMLIPNRHGNTPAYRYGFQGQEKDDEIKGEGNSLNYTFRMHDPRVGRFFARDPLEKYYAEQTPYQFSSNAPIHARELEGCETAHDMRFERRERQLLAGEITPKQFREQNNAEGVGALLGLAIVATAYSGGRAAPVLETLFYRVAFEGVKRQMYIIAAGNFAIGFFDEGGQIDTPGSLDDMGRSTRLIFGKMANSKFAQKFIFTMGKLDFALGEGTTVGKNMARITDNEITNMAKSILRGEKFKENGIDTQQKLLGLVDEAFDKGVEIFSKIPNTVNGKVIGTVDVKQLTLKDGTRVNFNFLTETGTVTPRLATVSIPDANVNIGAKVKELKIIRATAKAAEIKESK